MVDHRPATLLLCALLALPAAAQAAEPVLEGRAVLPADTFASGPPSGAFTGSANGRTTPFASQPVEGFSAVLDAGEGSYWAMPDNGYGGKANSRDFLLRMYRIRPEFKTASGGSGAVSVQEFLQLRDPDGHVPFPIERASQERWLTGFDFDIESVRQAANGDLWFGDEYGPFLLHTDSTGKLLEPPISSPPGVVGEDNPLRGTEPFTLRRSGGFEGMGLSTGGPCNPPGGAEVLHPMLEKSLEGDRLGASPRRRFIYSFSLAEGRYTGEPRQYRTESSGYAIGDLTNVDEHRLLVIERDGTQGATANFKRVYLVDLRETDNEGYLVKRQVADLMAIRDPAGVSLPGRPGDIGLGDPFRFPFANIETILPLDRERLLVLNDNNYPYDNGRSPDRPDDNEAIVVRVDALCEAPAPPADPTPTDLTPGLVPEIPGGLDEVPDPDRVGPTAKAFSATPRRFRVGGGATRPVVRRGARRGTTFRYALSEKGRVKIEIDHARPGRRGVTFRRVGVLSHRALVERGSVRFSGRLGRRVLRPGRYRATLTATDAAGNSGRSRAVMLRIIR